MTLGPKKRKITCATGCTGKTALLCCAGGCVSRALPSRCTERKRAQLEIPPRSDAHPSRRHSFAEENPLCQGGFLFPRLNECIMIFVSMLTAGFHNVRCAVR